VYLRERTERRVRHQDILDDTTGVREPPGVVDRFDRTPEHGRVTERVVECRHRGHDDCVRGPDTDGASRVYTAVGVVPWCDDRTVSPRRGSFILVPVSGE
jgi:hypothetical protein